MLIRGNAEPFPDISCSDAIGTLAPQPVPPGTMHVKLHYTIDFYSCNSTEKRFPLVVTTTSIPYILHTL